MSIATSLFRFCKSLSVTSARIFKSTSSHSQKEAFTPFLRLLSFCRTSFSSDPRPPRPGDLPLGWNLAPVQVGGNLWFPQPPGGRFTRPPYDCYELSILKAKVLRLVFWPLLLALNQANIRSFTIKTRVKQVLGPSLGYFEDICSPLTGKENILWGHGLA